jgi:hypothetical protein
MLDFKDFKAPTVEGARAQADDWLTQLPAEVKVLNVETHGGTGIRVWVLVPKHNQTSYR